MPRFRLTWNVTTTHTAIVEADTMNEAWRERFGAAKYAGPHHENGGRESAFTIEGVPSPSTGGGPS